MEENRLKPMVDGYDEKLFNQLYFQTEGLRKNLAAGIDCRRFGVDYEEVLSWFTIKFIYTFNKYCHTKPDLLLGYIINSLKMYKLRIIKQAYTVKFSQSILHVEDNSVIENSKIEFPPYDLENTPDKISPIINFLRSHLSDNALMLLEIQLNPPLFILSKLNTKEIPSIHKIPSWLICEYLGIEECEKSSRYIDQLKKQINSAIRLARLHFRALQSSN